MKLGELQEIAQRQSRRFQLHGIIFTAGLCIYPLGYFCRFSEEQWMTLLIVVYNVADSVNKTAFRKLLRGSQGAFGYMGIIFTAG